jgi:hypothetical protein
VASERAGFRAQNIALRVSVSANSFKEVFKWCEVAMAESENRWVARLTPTTTCSIDVLLGLPMGMDVWERHGDALVVAASEAQLSELERRRLAHVQRLSSQAEFETQAERRAARDDESRSE